MHFQPRSGASAWLGVAITSVAFMGVYAFLIVMARTPVIGQLFTQQDFFRTGLVTHVVLAVVIWFLAFILFVTHYITSETETRRYELWAASGGLLGVALIVSTPFTGASNPQLNNYVPILDRGIYFAGLTIFFISAMAAATFRAPLLIKAAKARSSALMSYGSLLLAAAALFSALVCIAIAWFSLQSDPLSASLTPQEYFEFLFWGGGHTLQFANALGMMAVWTILAEKLSGKPLISNGVAKPILLIMGLFILTAPLQYGFNDYDTPELRYLFTLLKGWGLSLGPLVLGIAIIKSLGEMKQAPPIRRGLLFSIFLFGLGGFITLLLDGSDTRVPAHYHGVIGAVTISFMTLGLWAIRENAWLTVRDKWITMQLTAYGLGQSMFVIGLFIGGSRGAQRKTFGTAQNLDDALKFFGMSIMGLGGVLAILAGAVFVLFMIKAYLGYRRNRTC